MEHGREPFGEPGQVLGTGPGEAGPSASGWVGPAGHGNGANGGAGANGTNGGPPAPPAAPQAPLAPPPPPQPQALMPGSDPMPGPGLMPGADVTTGQFPQVGHAPAAGPGQSPSAGGVLIPSAAAASPAVAPVPRAFPLIPEPEEDGAGGGATGHNYIVGGNVLGIALGVITVVALVWALVVAIRTEPADESLSARASANRSSGQTDGGSVDADTSTSGSAAATGGDTTAAAAGTDAAAGAASGDTSGGAADGGGGGAAGGGAFKFAPPPGKYAATGTGFRKNTPTGVVEKVSNPSIEIAAAGGGCVAFKANIDPGNSNTETLCATSDGGVVQTKNVQYLKTTIVANLTEENTSTMTCSPPEIMVPANVAAGVGGAGGGTCLGTNSSTKVPGKYQQTGTFTVVGKEQVAGVEAWHVRRAVKMAPASSDNTQAGTIGEDTWYATSNGLPVRWVQKANVTSTVAGVIKVLYEQEVDITMTSTTPS